MKIYQKLIATCLAAIQTVLISISAYAEMSEDELYMQEKNNWEIAWEAELKYRTEFGKESDEFIDFYGDGVGGFVLPQEQFDCFKNQQNAVITLDCVYEEAIAPSVKTSFGEWQYIELCVSYSERYTYKYNVGESKIINVADIIKYSGIPDTSQLIGVIIGNSNVYAWIKGYNFYYGNNWFEQDGNNYYVKPNGTLATKSAIVDNVRYKFDSNGVCEGVYTGWTSKANKYYYYKNGIKLKSRWIKVDGKRTYFLKRDGSRATGTVKISGAYYTFDKNGKLV